ncbi:PLDc_N domain-containing protein [Candidatus Woesearchaeota archaeon]|nr:PLDc_N domain-containing protein [Candidatus Woesearchaeota archaeon]
MSGLDGLLMGFAWMNLLILFLGVLMLVAAVLGFIFWIAMLVDCVRRKLPDGEKIAWVLVMVFLHALGALIYYVVVRRKK